jgi:energy-coupling factor transporter ATP-binding protein EcfA2
MKQLRLKSSYTKEPFERSKFIGEGMLLEFKVSNFRSFDEEQILGLVASVDDRLENSIIGPTETRRANLRLLPSVLVYGANASGKSSLCKAFQTFQNIVAGSATTLTEGDELPGIVPFRLSSEERMREPSRFEATFVLSGDLYRYGFEATPEQVHKEWIGVTRQGVRPRESMILEREGSDPIQWVLNENFKWPREMLRERTRPNNGLILSKAAQENVESLKPLFRAIRTGLRVVNLAGDPKTLVDLAVRRCEGDDQLRELLIKAAIAVDAGIDSLTIDHKERSVLRRIPGDDGTSKLQRTFVPEPVLNSVKRRTDGTNVQFKLSDESNGTQRFLAIVSLLYTAWSSKQVLVIDELESSLHTLLVQLILQLMQDPDFASFGAQFVLATHDTNLLDLDYVRRDQVVIAEKDYSGATRLSSLFANANKPRPEAALERQYLSGRFGGTPVFGNLRGAFLDALYPGEDEGSLFELV